MRNEYHDRADLSSGRAHRIVEGLFSNPIVRVADVARRLDITYPTAKGDIDKLVEGGILSEMAGTYPKAFYAREIFNAAYRED